MNRHGKYFRERGTHNGVAYCVYGKTKKECREKVLKKIAEIESGVVSGDMTVAAWAEKWLETYVKPVVSTKEYQSKQSRMRNYLLPAVGRMKLKSVRPAHLQTVLNNLTCGESYGRKILQTFHQIFSTAKQNKLIADDPTEALHLPKLTRAAHRRAITAEERALLSAVALEHRGGLWVMLQLLCGLRPSEAAAVQKIDLTMGDTLHVYKAVDRNQGGIKTPKTEAGTRDVPIPAALREFINCWPFWSGLQPFDYIATTLSGDLMRDGAQRCMWASMRREMDIRNDAQLYRNAVVVSTLAADFTPYCYVPSAP